MNFETSIQKWVTLDNKIKCLSEELKEVRADRNSIGSNILTYVETQELSNATVNISDGKIRFGSIKSTSPLTLKHVEFCLRNCIQDTNQVASIMKYIKDAREVKESPDIKRSYTKN